MNDVSSAMRNVLNKCEISVDGNTFSKEVLIQAYAEFLSQTMEKGNIMLALFYIRAHYVLMR